VVVRRGLDPDLTRRLQQALLALGDGTHRDLLSRLYNVDGYVAVTHETYADVERVARDYGFIED
jgi:ABC-type phosphate/phosphonate transport system substrate-binding protein